MVITKKSTLKIIMIITIIFIISVSCLMRIFPVNQDEIYKPQSTLVFSREGEVLRAFTSKDERWRLWTPLEDISPDLKEFVLAYEDRWFYYHPGINPLAVIRAAVQNLRSGQVISGGSTITMQIARMIDPKPRTFKNKCIEALRAIQLELMYTKDELFEIYLNMAPYGGNIEGVEAASWLYFNKSAKELSYGEAALLAALPNNPENIRPDRNFQIAVSSRNKVLKRMYKNNILKYKDYLQAIDEQVPDRKIEWPIKAAHLARDLHLSMSDNNKIRTTIDSKIQGKAENFLKRYVGSLKEKGITNGAVVIIDNKNNHLLAEVGSADFFSKENQGQVNGAKAARSPGSALKPFLYALAVDRGLISPASKLEDVPINYAGYEPENYDRKYHGMVSARKALEQSLNVPAVNLNNGMAKGHDFYDFLKGVGLSTIRDENDYGLSLILGGCEVTLYELTELYTTFAKRGRFIKTKVLVDQEIELEKQLFNPGTSFIISEILSEITRPDLPRVWKFTDLPKIAWKTGTSYGHKDAWSIGYNKEFTIGVWIGNFNAAGSPYLIGSYAAAPLLFDLFTELNRSRDIDWFMKPYMVKKRKVCSVSGQLPTEYCSTLIEEYYLEDISPTGKCDFHKNIYIDNKTGKRVPPGERYNNNISEKIYIDWPSRVATWRIQSNYPVYTVPELDTDYNIQLAGKAPIINSPSRAVSYYIRGGIPIDYQKISLSASVSSDVRKVYWFVDGVFLGSVEPGKKLFYYPERGKHSVICQDDKGRSSVVMIEIN